MKVLHRKFSGFEFFHSITCSHCVASVRGWTLRAALAPLAASPSQAPPLRLPPTMVPYGRLGGGGSKGGLRWRYARHSRASLPARSSLPPALRSNYNPGAAWWCRRSRRQAERCRPRLPGAAFNARRLLFCRQETPGAFRTGDLRVQVAILRTGSVHGDIRSDQKVTLPLSRQG